MPSASQLLSLPARGYAWLRHSAASPFVRAAYFSLLALGAMWTALGKATSISTYQDSHQHTLFEEAARLSVAKFHQLPLWDPYFCGGIAGLGTPSARFVSPTFVLSLLFGTLRGATFTAMVMTVIGLEGAYRYARVHGAGALGAMTAAPVFALSGVFAHATLVSWTNFFGFELMPWALLGVRLAMGGSRRGAVLTALSMGWMVGFGGTYTAPLTLLGAAFEVCTVLARQVRRKGRLSTMSRAAWMGVVVFLLSMAVSMVRLWPVAENLQASPRILGGTPGTAPIWVWKHLFGDEGNKYEKGDFLIGLPVLPLLAYGIFRKRAIAPAIGVALWMWFATGYKVDYSIFAILRTIPPYTMLRAPERFLTFVALAAATIAALGIRKLEAKGRKQRAWLLLAGVFHLLLLGDAVLLANHSWIRADARSMDPPLTEIDRDFRQSRGNRWIADYYPVMSRGSLTCFDDYDVVQSSELRGDLPAEEYLKDPTAGTVTRVFWSPSRIDLHVSLTKPARVYVNQNWHPGWRSNDGAVVSDDGLLAVDLPAGDHALTLKFWPRSAVAGMWTSFFGVVVASLLLYQATRGDYVQPGKDALTTIGFAAAPLLVIPLSLVLMREPKRPPAPLLTPTGEPMIIAAPAADTTPLDVKWENGITLVASHIDLDPSEDGLTALATVELDWRFDEKVPPGLGVFFQLEQPKSHFGTDHVLLSGVLLPEAAPLHTVLRDISVPIAIPAAGKTETNWKIWVGVWRARRDMSRLHIIDEGKTTTNSDRAIVGTFVVAP